MEPRCAWRSSAAQASERARSSATRRPLPQWLVRRRRERRLGSPSARGHRGRTEPGRRHGVLRRDLRRQLPRRRRHDRPDKVIFFEGARITLEAHIAEYPERTTPGSGRSLAIGDAWNPDRVIVLTSSTDTIEKHIRLRNRPHEVAENMVRRFRLIDARVPPAGAPLPEYRRHRPRRQGVPRSRAA